MSIAWIYLDKKAAAVSALHDYADMDFIIDNTPDDIADVRSKMTAIKAPVISKLPKSIPDPHAGEERLVSQIDEIDVLKERYRRALEYMSWFRPAWDALTDDERYILQEFFIRDGVSKTTAVLNISYRIHVERAQAYRYKDKALARLALLLFGIGK